MKGKAPLESPGRLCKIAKFPGFLVPRQPYKLATIAESLWDGRPLCEVAGLQAESATLTLLTHATRAMRRRSTSYHRHVVAERRHGTSSTNLKGRCDRPCR